MFRESGKEKLPQRGRSSQGLLIAAASSQAGVLPRGHFVPPGHTGGCGAGLGLVWRGVTPAGPSSCRGCARGQLQPSEVTPEGDALQLTIDRLWAGEMGLALASHSLSIHLLQSCSPFQPAHGEVNQFNYRCGTHQHHLQPKVSSCTSHSLVHQTQEQQVPLQSETSPRITGLITKGINNCREVNFNDISVPSLSEHATSTYSSSLPP